MSKKRGVVGKFFHFIWRALKVVNVLVFGLAATLILGALLFALFNLGGQKIPQDSALLIDPAGSLVEQKSELAVLSLLQGDDLPQQVLVKDIVDAVLLAKDDSRIEFLVLQLDKLHDALLPKLASIASAIEAFKTSGKKVIAIGDNYSQSALLLAALADEVLMNPEGYAFPEGFAVYRPYFKSLLEKHQVTVNVFSVGKYKSAADPFFLDNMSEDDRVAWMGVLDPMWDAYTTRLEMARGLTAGSINSMLENASEEMRTVEGNLGRLALEAGFVDRLVTSSEQREYLIELAGEDSDKKHFRHVSFKDYLKATRKPDKHGGDKVAVIKAVGNIVDGSAPAGEIGSKSLSKLIRKARLDENVRAIVLRIDSGGGSKTASEIIRAELQAAQDAGITVVASMGSVAASGGYWIAASADEIWAMPNTITGSIGIIGLLPTFEKTLANYGVFTDGVATTPIAGGINPMRGLSPVYADLLQTTIDAGYQQFLTTVATGRDIDIDAVHEVAQGRVWTGAKAQQFGLVDSLGDLEEAIKAAARLANVEDYSLWYVEPERSVEEQLIRSFADNASSVIPQFNNNPVARIRKLIRSELGFLERLNDPHHAYVICGDCPGVL